MNTGRLSRADHFKERCGVFGNARDIIGLDCEDCSSKLLSENYHDIAQEFSFRTIDDGHVQADQVDCQLVRVRDRAREHEHLNQFVLRGAPRDHDFAGVYDVYVEGLDQGERLGAYMNSIGFPDVLVDLLELQRKQAKPETAKAGRKAYQTKEEAAAKKKARNARAYKARKDKTEKLDASNQAQVGS